MKTFVHFKRNIEMDLDFYVRARRCKKNAQFNSPYTAITSLIKRRLWNFWIISQNFALASCGLIINAK